MKLCISSENCIVIDQIVSEICYLQKEPKSLILTAVNGNGLQLEN